MPVMVTELPLEEPLAAPLVDPLEVLVAEPPLTPLVEPLAALVEPLAVAVVVPVPPEQAASKSTAKKLWRMVVFLQPRL